MRSLSPTDIRLPTEIVLMVCSYLWKQDQLSSRLVSGKLHYAATIHAFRSLRLRPDRNSTLQFREIALSEKLRTFVKEVTIETELDPGIRFHSDREVFAVCQNFLQFLPYLALFNNLKHLHLQFSRSSHPRDYNIEEGLQYRYLVLDIISHCAVGMWTPENRKTIYAAELPAIWSSHMFTYTHDGPALPGDSLQIKELTISHLADYNDPRLIQSKAWNKLLRLPTLIDLKLLVGEDHVNNRTDLAVETSEFFSALPSQWLQPDLVQKLQVLSLFYIDFWGWFPRMDLSQLGDLPTLKVLALGRYIFTDKKQTDWIASLGKRNKSGGLEELYLDECCIMFEVIGPLTIDGYPVQGVGINWNADVECTRYGRRWHHVLSEWRTSMKGLKKFVMGVGDFGYPSRTIVPFCPRGPLTEDMRKASDPPEWYFGHNRHRFFADPGPKDFVIRLIDAYQSRRRSSRAVPMGNYLLGTGLTQSRRAQMRYAAYEVGLPYGWLIGNHQPTNGSRFTGIQFTNGDYDPAWAPEEKTVEFDDAAYALLMETIRDRIRS
ncbi:hypothetical protein FPCIR_3402 [Fusarium pseudocircinatum]|uniref:F-box domain-containing protein n=1 Tax=Fusarium pseudocircinatum TaxID=56676 RepID=A0A8H5USK4_9HYPO|nr:hypothetical protein FPCIR_3402 [Fusarium pseudocircinatum]